MRYFEDFEEGTSVESTDHFILTEENIIQFCKEWDPAPFHVDKEMAAKLPLGVLFTSSVHLLSICMKLSHSFPGEPPMVIAALGWDQIKFASVGCPGDTLRLVSRMSGKRRSKSNPQRGILESTVELINQRDEVVISYISSTLVQCRDAG